MKLALCLFNYFPHGGLQRDFLRVALTLKKEGHQVDVFTMSWQGDRHQLNVHIIKVRGLTNHRKVEHFSATTVSILQKQSYDLAIGFNKMEHLDVYYAADSCFKAKALSKGFFYRLLPRYRVFLRLEKAVFAANAKTQILMLNSAQQKSYQQYYPDIKQRCHLLPPHVHCQHYATEGNAAKTQRRNHLQVSSDDFILLMVCSRFHTKGVDRAIMALACLSAKLKAKTKLYIIGSDKPKKHQRLAKKLTLDKHVHFLGGLDNVLDYMSVADLLIHPARNEAAGIVLLEAMIAGLPVLCTDICGYAEEIRQAGSGVVLTSPFEQSSLIKNLHSMLDQNILHNYRQAGLRYAQQKDFANTNTAVIEIIEEIIKKQYDKTI